MSEWDTGRATGTRKYIKRRLLDSATPRTNGLVNGVPIATMAELLGHSDTKMISAHYAHLGLYVDSLKEAALQAAQSRERP